MALDAPEAADAAEAIKDASEEQRAGDARFRRRAAIIIGVLAMLLAISGLGGGNATKEMLNANIQSSDIYAFYQAKNIRQTSNQLAARQYSEIVRGYKIDRVDPASDGQTISLRREVLHIVSGRIVSDEICGQIRPW